MAGICNGRREGARYWYEGGKRQGLEGRGKEIYDPASDAWYWLDSDVQGKMAVNKDVYQPYTIQGQDETGNGYAMMQMDIW